MEKVSTFISARSPEDFLKKFEKSLTRLNEGHQFAVLTIFRTATARATCTQTNQGRSNLWYQPDWPLFDGSCTLNLGSRWVKVYKKDTEF